MRVYLLAALFVSASALLVFRDPALTIAQIDRNCTVISTKLEQWWYTKEIRVVGLHFMAESELRDLLPLSKSYLWWRTNVQKIETQLLNHPLIERVELEQCSQESFLERCFLVEVHERSPRYIALLGKRAWVLSSDSTFLAPLDPSLIATEGTVRRLMRAADGATLLKGADNSGISPDQVHARLWHVTRAADKISEKLGMRIKELQIEENGDLNVKFRGKPYRMVFEFSEARVDQLDLQVERAGRVLAEFGSRDRHLDKIDLGFDNVAVVTARGTSDNDGGPTKVNSRKHKEL